MILTLIHLTKLKCSFMKITLLSCSAQRPDRRAIARCIAEIATDVDDASANELVDILLEGDSVDFDMDDNNTSSSFRALRKLSIDYEME